MAERSVKAESVSSENSGCPSDSADKDARENHQQHDNDDNHDSTTQSDCVVCLQKYHHPVQLPCGHVFCFLCVKGVAARSQRCALCRAEVPSNYFDNPVLVDSNKEKNVDDVASVQEKKPNIAECKWFYEGRNGWWQYEERASVQLEEAFQNGEQTTELVIAGFSYIVDIGDMVQYRKNYPTRRRRIKRDKASADKKGIAGLKFIAAKTNTENMLSNADEVKSELQSKQDVDKQVDSVTEQLNNL